MTQNRKRDIEIFVSFHNGCSKEELAREHGLTPERVGAIISGETHRRAVSQELFYKKMRMATS
jgi:Mor family transcriptional regulator